MKYTNITYKNSNNSRRRKLFGWFADSFGQLKWRDHFTNQTVRADDGHPLLHIPFVSKRNKYVPHVGKKQLAKMS